MKFSGSQNEKSQGSGRKTVDADLSVISVGVNNGAYADHRDETSGTSGNNADTPAKSVEVFSQNETGLNHDSSTAGSKALFEDLQFARNEILIQARRIHELESELQVQRSKSDQNIETISNQHRHLLEQERAKFERDLGQLNAALSDAQHSQVTIESQLAEAQQLLQSTREQHAAEVLTLQGKIAEAEARASDDRAKLQAQEQSSEARAALSAARIESLEAELAAGRDEADRLGRLLDEARALAGQTEQARADGLASLQAASDALALAGTLAAVQPPGGHAGDGHEGDSAQRRPHDRPHLRSVAASAAAPHYQGRVRAQGPHLRPHHAGTIEATVRRRHGGERDVGRGLV